MDIPKSNLFSTPTFERNIIHREKIEKNSMVFRVDSGEIFWKTRKTAANTFTRNLRGFRIEPFNDFRRIYFYGYVRENTRVCFVTGK